MNQSVQSPADENEIRALCAQLGVTGPITIANGNVIAELPEGRAWATVPILRAMVEKSVPVHSRCCGTPNIIRVSYEMQVAENFFNDPTVSAATRKCDLQEALPYLERIGKNAARLIGHSQRVADPDRKWHVMGEEVPEDGQECQLAGVAFISTDAFIYNAKQEVWENTADEENPLKYDGAWWTHWRPFINDGPGTVERICQGGQ